MLFTPALLDSLTAQAKASPRLRQHYDLRDSDDDTSQRMLNAIEPGTILPIHRHITSSETVVVLRGKGRWNYYDNDGNLTATFLLSANGEIKGASIPKGQWHNTESLESGTVILECKDGKYFPEGTETFLKK